MLDRQITPTEAAELQRAAQRHLLIWTVTTGTRDHGARYVARPHAVIGVKSRGPLAVYMIADSLDQLRAMLPPGLTLMARDPADNPVIVETWL